MFKGLFGGGEPPKALSELTVPWPTGRASWFERIEKAIAARGDRDEVLKIGPYDLYDRHPAAMPGYEDYANNDPRKSPYHPRVKALVKALGVLVKRPSDQAFAEYCRLASQPDVINIADPFSWACRELAEHHVEIGELMRRIARESPDAEPVKIALSLLGPFGKFERDRDLIMTLGAYDEFTPYAADALRLTDNSNPNLYALLKGVKGWGRVFALHSFKDVAEPEIKDWLLREAHHNILGTPAGAGRCAAQGGLLEALQNNPDERLIAEAGNLVRAMLNEMPEGGLVSYPESAAACLAYLERLTERPDGNLRQAGTVAGLKAFLAQQGPGWREMEPFGWTPAARGRMGELAAAYLARPCWPEHIAREMAADSSDLLVSAVEVAQVLGLDLWSMLFERQSRGQEAWTLLMWNSTPAQLDQVLELARKQLDLEAIGSGATQVETFGTDHEDDKALGFIVQELFRFPGAGWPLLQTALKGRVRHLRWMVLYTLSRTEPKLWPREARAALQSALAVEPDEGLRKIMSELLRA